MRSDANRIGLNTVRRVLAAARSLDLGIQDTPIYLEPMVEPQPSWPREIEGLDPEQDGPWPAPVRVACSWEGGNTELLLDVYPWPRSAKRYGDLVGLRVRAMDARRELFWSTVAHYFRDARDGDEVAINAWMTTWRRRSDPTDGSVGDLIPLLKQIAARSDLPMTSKSCAEMFRVTVPDGTVLPDPSTAYRRVLHAALIKLPFLVRGGETGIDGKSYLDVEKLVSATERPNPPTTEAVPMKFASVWPLPGGVRQYATTLLEILQWFAEEPRAEREFGEYLRERHDIRGKVAVQGYASVFVNLGVARVRDGRWELTEEGEAYLNDPRADRLFDLFEGRFIGMLETLVIADVAQGATSAQTHELLNQLLEKEWESNNQASFRRNWLLSLGLTDRTRDGDVLTESGRLALAPRAERVQHLRTEIEALLDALQGEAATPVAEEVEAGEIVSTEDDAATEDEGEPSGWRSERLDLRQEHVQEHLRGLALPPGLVDQAVAALSAGKHLLLVGPPGTGKTRLAKAMATAAAAEGYCHGSLTCTASADWTTFETIGGYHMRKDSSLVFRPGVFLRAVESWRWLLVDELNRADVDKAFGELMTVLSGVGAETPFELEDGRTVSLGPEAGRTHWLPKTFRLLATMNTWDKTSLFRLSYAFQRRFAMLHVEPPDDDAFGALVERWATGTGPDPELPAEDVPPLQRLFSSAGLLEHRAVGPSVAEDLLRFLRRRAAGGDGVAEGLTLYLLPQLEGLDPEPSVKVHGLLRDTLTGWASAGATDDFLRRYAELFPHVTFPEP